MANEALATATGLAKDIVAVLRDGVLFFVATMLVACPHQVNGILVNAGFQEGSLAGFKWSANLQASSAALEEAQATITDLRSENDKLLKALEASKQQLGDPAMRSQVEKLEKESSLLQASSDQVQASVTRTLKANAPLLAQAASMGRAPSETTHAKSELTVGLQTLGVTDEERRTMNDRLKGAGYSLDDITYSYALERRPGWFAQRSTVFYYASSSRADAQELADLMRKFTKLEFNVQRGAGLGVDPDRKTTTFFVHYVKNT